MNKRTSPMRYTSKRIWVIYTKRNWFLYVTPNNSLTHVFEKYPRPLPEKIPYPPLLTMKIESAAAEEFVRSIDRYQKNLDVLSIVKGMRRHLGLLPCLVNRACAWHGSLISDSIVSVTSCVWHVLCNSAAFFHDSFTWHMNESCHTYEWVMSHIWMSHDSFLKKKETVQGTLWNISVSHVTHINESCCTCEWVRSRIWTSHVTYTNEFCHESKDTYEWVMSHIWTSHVTHMNETCRTYEWVMSYIWMSHVTCIHESCHTYEWVMSHKW